MVDKRLIQDAAAKSLAAVFAVANYVFDKDFYLSDFCACIHISGDQFFEEKSSNIMLFFDGIDFLFQRVNYFYSSFPFHRSSIITIWQ